MGLRNWIYQKTGISLKKKNKKCYEEIKFHDPYNHVEYGKHSTLGNGATLSFDSNCKIGDYTYFTNGRIGSNCIFGRYCSFGENLIISPDNHPINWLSTHPFQYNKNFKKVPEVDIFNYDKLYNPPLTIIGNDVWCGHNVIILSGVKIGDGAIIGAGSVVTKNIPAYAIAVGNPAAIKKKRFSPEIIKKLLKLKWWELEAEALNGVQFDDIDKAIEQLSLLRKNNKSV